VSEHAPESVAGRRRSARRAQGRTAEDPRALRRRLRSFGLTVGTAFAVLGALLLWRQRASGPPLGALGALLLLLAALLPGALRPVERVWMRAATAMGWVMTRVILGLIFLLVFTPAGLVLRLLRKDPLELRFARHQPSYWRARAPRERAPERMERMF